MGKSWNTVVLTPSFMGDMNRMGCGDSGDGDSHLLSDQRADAAQIEESMSWKQFFSSDPCGCPSLPFTRMRHGSSPAVAFVPGCDRRRRLSAGNRSVPVSRQLAEVALDLDAMPELVRLTKEGPKSNRHGRSDRPPREDDFVSCPCGNTDGAGHGILRNLHRLEVFPKRNLSGRDGLFHIHIPLRHRDTRPWNFARGC